MRPRPRGSTFFAVMLASFEALLGRVRRQDDVAVGRAGVEPCTTSATESIVGNFVNTLVVRADLSGSRRSGEFVHQVQERLLRAQAHQDVPFETLVAELVTAPRHEPVAAGAGAVQHPPVRRSGSRSLAGLDLERSVRSTGSVAQFDLSVLVMHGRGRRSTPHVVVEFNADVFEVASVERLVEAWRVLLAAAVGIARRCGGGCCRLVSVGGSWIGCWVCGVRSAVGVSVGCGVGGGSGAGSGGVGGRMWWRCGSGGEALSYRRVG